MLQERFSKLQYIQQLKERIATATHMTLEERCELEEEIYGLQLELDEYAQTARNQAEQFKEDQECFGCGS